PASDGKDHCDIGGVNLLLERYANSPGKAPLAQALAERTGKAVSCIGKDTDEANAYCADPIYLGQRDFGLGPVVAQFLGNPGALQAGRIARPALRQEQPQAHHDWHFSRCQGERNQRLAVGILAECRSILWRHADRMMALLGQGRIVDDQPGILASDLSVSLGEQRPLQWSFVPHAAADEMVQPVVADLTIPRGHRLHALTITRANQACNVCWTNRSEEH